MEKSDSPIEARLTRLEVQVEHLVAGQHRLESRVDALDKKIGEQGDRSDRKTDSLSEKIAEVKDLVRQTQIWGLVLAGTVLGVMAHGFHWI